MLGHAVRYRALGEGPPVVLVPGLGGAGWWWSSTPEALARRHRVVVVELPGFEHSLAAPPFRLTEAPLLLERLLGRLELGRASLVGHSLGALACLGLAARSPQAVARLALIAPPLVTAGPRAHHHLLPLALTLARLPPRSAARLALGMLGRSPLALWRAVDELLAADHGRDLAAVRAPTLLVWGERDAIVPSRGSREMLRGLAGARLAMLPGAGHVPMLDRPAALNALLESFLEP